MKNTNTKKKSQVFKGTHIQANKLIIATKSYQVPLSRTTLKVPQRSLLVSNSLSLTILTNNSISTTLQWSVSCKTPGGLHYAVIACVWSHNFECISRIWIIRLFLVIMSQQPATASLHTLPSVIFLQSLNSSFTSLKYLRAMGIGLNTKDKD